ncbi:MULTISPECIES: NnrS family protein [unclassified Agrobacterium]|uniref:NnrS family protein n=1 Tax=unclassified Agrobacterium TaxID=2632611 RepID=UPI000857E227|nr:MULTISPECIES: NnrS family protein [unclassified Agrobacterium]AOG11735.1 nnrS family protein [Agrobacterium sp. RAC06]QGG91031.1 NnrS family protein [Agrobacterium sp. MA01]
MSVLPAIRMLPSADLARAMSAEGLRLMFPLAALHAALWPFLWVVVWSLDLPFASSSLPAHWHAQEMLVGSFGAALLGFLTSALPEWTDTRRISGRPLFLFAGLWAGARVLGLLAVESGWLIGLMFDQAWMLFLLAYALRLSWSKKSTDLLGFVLFVTAFAAAAAMLRIAMAFELYDLSESAIRILGFALLGLLGLALARITVPVTNLILDPTEKTSPYRPHPGRIHLSAGLTMLVIVAEAATLSDAVRGYLMLAAGAAFLDRVAEGFVGREGFSFELGGLWLSSALAGTGLLVCGLSLIGLDLPWLGGLHLALMGGLGLGVLQVLSIAGLLHTGQPLLFSKTTRMAILLLVLSVLLRILSEFAPSLTLPFSAYGFSSALFSLSFLLWAKAYIPLLWSPATVDQERC